MAAIADDAGLGVAAPGAVADDLVGRRRELASVERLVGRHRLVTVVGAGGVGKSRLAAATAAARPVGSTSVCELTAVPAAGGVTRAIVEALGYPSFEAAAVALVDRDRLLLLDNTDHVTDAAASATERLLATCPTVTVLATGREPLEVPGEHVVVLEPLDVPAGDEPQLVTASPAAQLFLTRARAAGAEVDLDPETLAAVAAICRRLDGLPLAVELAAARARSLSPAEILRHLDRRFELLARRRPRGPARHHSLETAIAWSHDRLEPRTRDFFDRLGAFCGPFTAAAATYVAGGPDADTLETIERLDTLVSRSLVRATVRSGRTWYELLESLRAYARDRLADGGDLDAYDARCVDYHVARAVEIRRAGGRRWSIENFVELFTLHANFQDAARWCLAEDATPDRAAQLFVPLWGLVHNGRAEAVLELGTSLLERWPDPTTSGGTPHRDWATVAAITATAAIAQGDPERARTLLAAADGDATAAVLVARARYLLCSAAGEHDAAARWLRRGIDAATAAGHAPWAVELEAFLALATWRREGAAAAVRQARRARDLATEDGSPILRAWADIVLGSLVALDDPPAAHRLLQAAADTSSNAEYPWGLGAARRARGAVALGEGELDVAARELRGGLERFVAIGHVAEVEATLRWVAALLVALGRPLEAARVLPPAGRPALVIVAVLEDAHLAAGLAELGPGAASYDLADAVTTARRALADAPPATATTAAGPLAPGLGTGEDAAAPEPSAGGGATARMVREGGVWALTYAALTVRLPDAKGLQDVATLLAQPGREVAATELMGAAVVSSDLGELLDHQARGAYERRIVELQAELDEAEAFADSARAERARTEFDQLVDALSAGTGLGGRARRSGSTADRARSAVTWRIRAAIGRVEQVHPTLGAHLRAAVRTGRWCVYDAADGPRWTVDP